MEQDIDKLIVEQFERLPKSLQEAIWATDYTSALQNLMQKHDLRVDAANVLENEVGLVLLGLAHPNELPQNLQEHMGLPDEKADRLAHDIDTEILAPVRDMLKSLWAEEEQSMEQTDPKKSLLPTGVLKAKLGQTVHITSKQDESSEHSTNAKYQEQDPYREPIE